MGGAFPVLSGDQCAGSGRGRVCLPVWGLEDALPAVRTERALSCLPDEQTYLLRDVEAEVLFSFSLEESLKRAHVSPLFKVTGEGTRTSSRTAQCLGGQLGPRGQGAVDRALD